MFGEESGRGEARVPQVSVGRGSCGGRRWMLAFGPPCSSQHAGGGLIISRHTKR